MIRLACDTDTLDDLDGHFPIVMTYSDLVPNPPELRAKFPDSELVLIDRGLGDPSGEASIADLERGALTVDHFPAWFDAKVSQGVKYITGYVNRSNLAAFNAVLNGRHPFRWVATLDGTLVIQGFRPMREPALVQFAGASATGAHIDVSAVYEASWHPQGTAPNLATVRREVNGAISQSSELAGTLHRMAVAIGG